MKLNWKFKGVLKRVQMKKPSMGEVWIFSGATLYYSHVIILHVINRVSRG